MTTATGVLQPPTGTQVVTLTSWAGDATFPVTPTAGMQLTGADTLTIGVDGVVTGADGSYSLTLIDSAGLGTAYSVAHSITSPDLTAPTLSTPIGTATSDTTADLTVSTDEANGTLYVLVSSGSAATAADIVSLGTAQAVSATGIQTASVTGLTASSVYYAHFVHTDAAANQSAPVTSTQFTTNAATASGTLVTTTGVLQPPIGMQVVTLTSWAGDAVFPITPTAGMQLAGASGLSIGVDGTVTGADGSYSLTLIDGAGAGTAYSVAYQIGAGAQVPQGTITIGTITVGETTALVPFTYSAADQTGFEYSLDGGAWTTATSPISLSTSTASTPYTIQVRAVNATGAGTAASQTFTTDAVTATPVNVTTTGVLAAPTGWQIVTLPAGYNNTLFTQEGVAFEFEATDKTGWQFGIEADPLDVELTLSGTDIVLTIPGVNDGFGNLTRPAGIDLLPSVLINPATSGIAHGIQIDTTNIPLYDPTDTTPAAFTLTNLTNQVRSVTVESNTITVLGVDAATDIPVSIAGGEYAVDAGSGFGGWTSASTNVQLNYQIKVRVTTSASDTTGQSATLTVGGVSDTFTATTGDFTAPVITLAGANPLTITQDSVFTDPGATAVDAVDGSVSVTQSGSVDVNVPATYTRTYTAVDADGNSTTATRTVIVEETPDTTAPVVTAPANTTLQFPFGFAGLGHASSNLQSWLNSATAIDDRDGLTGVANNLGSQVNPLIAGSYTITFTSIDAAGNSGTDTAVLTVVQAAAPVAPTDDVWGLGRAKIKAHKSPQAHKKVSAYKLKG